MVERLQEVFREKSDFVENQLFPLINKINTNVSNLEYWNSTHAEWITILFSDGSKKRVNVTCDSFRAIVLDVLKKI